MADLPEEPTLTLAQVKALECLSRGPAAAAVIGWAISPGQRRPLKAQGAGRLGGTMAWRLMRMGLTRMGDAHLYEITSDGRAALRRHLEERT